MRSAQETHTWMEMSVNVGTGLNSIMFACYCNKEFILKIFQFVFDSDSDNAVL